MPEEKITWIYQCGNDWNYCRDGFCDRYNQLKEDRKRPAVEMSKEWKTTTGIDWKPNAIRKQFYALTVTKGNDCNIPKPEYETCAVADLERLIGAGKKFGTINNKKQAAGLRRRRNDPHETGSRFTASFQ